MVGRQYDGVPGGSTYPALPPFPIRPQFLAAETLKCRLFRTSRSAAPPTMVLHGGNSVVKFGCCIMTVHKPMLRCRGAPLMTVRGTGGGCQPSAPKLPLRFPYHTAAT